MVSFSSQTQASQIAFLCCLVRQPHAVPARYLQQLQSTPFVPVGNGSSTRSPGQVVDPESSIGVLFDANDDNLPHTQGDSDTTIIGCLRSLHLLRTEISSDIVKERVEHICSCGSGTLIPLRLLHILESTRFDCSSLKNDLNMSWLPTTNGLRSPQQCRDHTEIQPRALFDQVLDVLDTGRMKITSPSLRRAFGWDENVPTHIIKEQLSRVLSGGRTLDKFDRLNILLPELGRRLNTIKGTRLEEDLKQITAEQPWIPIRRDLIATTPMTLIGGHTPLPGFCTIPPQMIIEQSTVELLRLMGCPEV